MFRPLHTLNTWAATLAVAALFAVSPARSAPIDDCEAYAGTITTDSTQQCLVNGSVTLIAVPGGDAVVPPGYQIGYVLTRTNGLSIEQVGPDPSFTVSAVEAVGSTMMNCHIICMMCIRLWQWYIRGHPSVG